MRHDFGDDPMVTYVQTLNSLAEWIAAEPWKFGVLLLLFIVLLGLLLTVSWLRTDSLHLPHEMIAARFVRRFMLIFMLQTLVVAPALVGAFVFFRY